MSKKKVKRKKESNKDEDSQENKDEPKSPVEVESSLEVKEEVTFKAMKVYKNHNLLEDEITSEKFLKIWADEESLRKIWGVTFHDDFPENPDEINIKEVVRGTLDFLGQLGIAMRG